MDILLKKYDLPDLILFENTQSETFKVWIPQNICIVLGQSNTIENSLLVENILKEEIPVYKRPSGGQTVVLTPNTIIISVVVITDSFKNPQYYFKQINEKVIDTLKNIGIEGLLYKGISDIAIGEKKILGSSIYRSKDKLLYHAVLNVSESGKTFERYLKHPAKEPDYRKGRSHSEFVTSLKDNGCNIEIPELVEMLTSNLQNLTYK